MSFTNRRTLIAAAVVYTDVWHRSVGLLEPVGAAANLAPRSTDAPETKNGLLVDFCPDATAKWYLVVAATLLAPVPPDKSFHDHFLDHLRLRFDSRYRWRSGLG